MSRRKRKADREQAGPAWQDRVAAFVHGTARRRWFFPAALVVLTLAVHARSVESPLIYWDDYQYLYEDTRIRELSPANAWKILTTSFSANYHPLTTFTFALDRAIWGERLWGFHLTQLAFYTGGVVLL